MTDLALTYKYDMMAYLGLMMHWISDVETTLPYWCGGLMFIVSFGKAVQDWKRKKHETRKAQAEANIAEAEAKKLMGN